MAPVNPPLAAAPTDTAGLDAPKPLLLPLSGTDVRDLSVGDTVAVSGDITISIGLPTHRRMADEVAAGRALPVDLRGSGFFHLSAYLEEQGRGDKPRALYMNPSTSTRYNAWMPALIRGLGLRLVGGKGGLDAASVEALRESGCVYLSFLGGGCPLLSRAIESVVASHWTEYISQFRLTTLRVRELPATVAIDAHGRSIYADLNTTAVQKLPQVLEALRAQREAAPRFKPWSSGN